jgi:esterase
MNLFFRQSGKGDPMIILHGLFGLSDNWVTIAKRLSERFMVYIPDLRNHGQSPHSPVFTLDALVEDLEEFIDEQHILRPILVGHSLGGLVAMQFSLHDPELVGKLVVVDISLRRNRDYSEHRQLIDAMKKVDFSLASVRSDVERQLMESIPSARIRQFLLKNVYWRDKNTMGWRLNLDVLEESLPLEINDPDPTKKFSGEALFIRGEKSGYLTDEDLPEIYRKFPNAELSTIPGAGHWVHADAPEEFLASVNRFLSK